MVSRRLGCLPLLFLIVAHSAAFSDEVVRVELRPRVVRSIGGVTEFDRDQFVTIHESPDSSDMTPADRRRLRRRLDIRYGRNGGLLSWQAKRVPAAIDNPDMPDIEQLRRLARRPASNNRPGAADLRQTVLCTHPPLMHARPNNKHAAWGPRSYAGVAEFTAQFINAYYTENARPRYVEVFNEPFVKARKMGTTVEALSEQHNHVARRIHELCPDVLVGGYSAAYVELELNNFGHFDHWQRRFMDIAGEEMDFFSYHVYDGVNVVGEPRVRTGSNSEAIMDLIATYSHIKFGVAKPILITEYGGIPEASMAPVPYDAKRTAGMLYSLLGQLMTFMDHPDLLAKVIPFILGKGEWTYNNGDGVNPGDANVFLLWRRNKRGEHVETDLFKFYEYLRGVSGQWRVSRSDNPDVRAHLLVDGQRLVLMLMNLDDAGKRVSLTGLNDLNVASVTGRFLLTDGDEPVLGERKLRAIPQKVDLRPGAAAMIIAGLKEPLGSDGVVREDRCYAAECTKDIEARRPVRFTFKDVPTGRGEVVVRISSGREPGLRKLPKLVRVNGKRLEVPRNWAGGEQKGRKNFFGTIEVKAPAELIEPETVVDVIYPDSGGKVASVVLQTVYEQR